MKKLFLYLANLKLAIIILLTLALFSSIGSIIEQNKEPQFYQNHYNFEIFGIPFYQIILRFSFQNIYTSYWFLSLLFLLAISLISCTILQQLPTLKFSKRYYFYKQQSQYKKLLIKLKSNKVCKTQLSSKLVDQKYSLFFQKNCIYAYKGLISRLGPIIVHFSLIFILIGSTISALKGFTAQELIPKSEIFHIQNIVKNGAFAQIPQNSFRVNDFWSIYSSKGDITQFYSDISVLDNQANEIKRKTISVNNPLLFKDLLLYQSDWGIVGFRTEIKNKNTNSIGQVIQIPVLKLNEFNSQFWVSSFPFSYDRDENYIILLQNNRGQINIFNTKGQFIKTQNLGQIVSRDNYTKINFIEILSSTGILIKSDPGIKVIYSGFFTLMISSLLSYLSFSEFWLLKTSNGIFSGAQTNRSKVKLKIEFLNLQQYFID